MAGSTGFRITSTTFSDGHTMPLAAVHTSAGGQNLSPQLTFVGEPAGTNSFAVTMFDPDAPTTVGFSHWVMFDIDPVIHELRVGAGTAATRPVGSVLGFTDMGVAEYAGASPPPGDPAHRYICTVYALDVPTLGGSAETTYAAFRFMSRNSVLASASITVTFGY